MQMQSSSPPWPPQKLQYREHRPPLIFPESAEVPEHPLHLDLRTALYLLLKRELRDIATVRSDQCVYWNASDPQKCIAPDVFVRLSPDMPITPSWKVWELGAPDVAIEIISQSDASAAVWQSKLNAYGALGVRELLRFEPDSTTAPLRIWDRVEGSLLERDVQAGFAPSSVVRLFWTVAPLDDLPVALRIARAASKDQVVPTATEREAQATKRIAELEQELKTLKGE